MNKFSFPDTLGELREVVNDLWKNLPDSVPLLNWAHSTMPADFSQGIEVEQVMVKKLREGYDIAESDDEQGILAIKVV